MNAAARPRTGAPVSTMILELHVAAMPGCPDPIEVVAMAQAKAPPGWTVLAHAEEADARAVISLDPGAGEGPSVGRLDGSLGARSLEGATCATVAEALTFALALRLPSGVDSPRVDPPRPQPRPAQPAPVPGTAARPADAPDRESRPHAVVEVGGETSFAWGLAPSPWAAGLFAGVHLRGVGAFTPGLRTTFLRGFPGRPDAEANAVFERFAVRLDTCPIGADAWRLHLSGCVGVGIEALSLQTGESTVVEVVSRDDSVTDSPATVRVNVLAALRTQVRAVDPLLLEVTTGIVLNPAVEGFAFDDRGQAFESSGLAPFVGVALGVSIE
ncbi:MAG: hypothetical protein U0414_41800 [Polyangiaceae bacterium]